MTSAEEFDFTPADLGQAGDLAVFRQLNDAYFAWMDGELARVTGKGLQDIAGMDRARYVDLTVEVALAAVLHTAQVYFLCDGAGRAVAMGGLRTLPDGTPEIVRIFTLLDFRGCGRKRRPRGRQARHRGVHAVGAEDL